MPTAQQAIAATEHSAMVEGSGTCGTRSSEGDAARSDKIGADPDDVPVYGPGIVSLPVITYESIDCVIGSEALACGEKTIGCGTGSRAGSSIPKGESSCRGKNVTRV